MCPRRIMFQRFAVNRVERDLVGVALSTFTKAAQQRPEVASFEMGGKGERFGLGWQPAGCETRHDLVSRARGKQKYTALPEIYALPPSGTHRACTLEPLILPVIARRNSLDRSVPLVRTRRVGPVTRRVGEVQA
jgi:hypothetical protein